MAAPDAGTAARRELEDFAVGVEEELVDRGLLVVTELVANSVRHAGLLTPQRIELGLSLRAERLRIEVADDGPGFDPIASRPDDGQESGWGLWLVDQLADRWGVDEPGARVWCELDRPGDQRGQPAARSARRQGPPPSPSVNAVGAFLADDAGAASYRRAQREALKGAAKRDAPHPIEFDESGFPIRQRTPGFLERAARLLKP